MSERQPTIEKHLAVMTIEQRADTETTTSRLGRAIRIASVALTIVTVGLAANILQLLAAPLTFFNRPLSHRLNSYVTLLAWTLSQYWMEGQDNVKLTLSGLEDIPMEESAFVIANHAFFGDFFMIHAIGRRKRMMAYCRYFLKDSIKYIPVFGWGMYLCNMPFLKRNWQSDSHRISQSLNAFVEYKLPAWLVSHVEGSRICTEKVKKSHAFAKANDLPILKYVLLPRCKGFVSTIAALRGSHIQYVYDVTLAYHHRSRGFGATPSLFEVLTGGLDEYQMHAHIERTPISAIPAGEDQMSRWLYDSYVKKDDLLEQIKEAFDSKMKMI